MRRISPCEVETMEGSGDLYLESDEESTSTDAQPPAEAVISVWERMAANISTEKLEDSRTRQLIVDGMRTEDGRACGNDMPINVKGTTPKWKELGRLIVQRAANPVSNAAFEKMWTGSTLRSQGCEVLIECSRASNHEKHNAICLDEIFSGVDGTFYDRTSVSDFELAMYALLTRADNLVVIMRHGPVAGYFYWSQGSWIYETDKGSSRLQADVMDASISLLTDLHNHHAKCLKSAEALKSAGAAGDETGGETGEAAGKEKQDRALQKKSNASRAGLARHGFMQNRNVVQLLLNIKKRMSLSAAQDPFDVQAKHLLPFNNGVMNLMTREFRTLQKHDYVLMSTGREWHPPTPELVETIRELIKSMLPIAGVRKTLYSMMRLCLGGQPAEKFWILTGPGRNGKGVVVHWLEHLLSELFSDMPMCALTVPLSGAGASPEIRKAHRVRVLSWTEPQDPDDEDGGGPNKIRRGLALLLANIKTFTGEARITARNCSSNDSKCELFGSCVLQCNKLPTLVGEKGDAVRERVVVIDFPFTFTADAELLRNQPEKYRPINPELKDVNFMEKHYCALVQLLLEECPDGKPFIAPECALAASSYLSTQDSLQSFLDEFCIREETAPVRQWLGVKEVFAKYNEETGAKLKEKDMKEKLKQHRATEGDYYEKGAATLSDRPLRRNTNNGLLNWRLKWQDCSESSKQQRVA